MVSGSYREKNADVCAVCKTTVAFGRVKSTNWCIEMFGDGRIWSLMKAGTVKACAAPRLTRGGTFSHFFPWEIHSFSVNEWVVDIVAG
jgi:hypothetical protein